MPKQSPKQWLSLSSALSVLWLGSGSIAIASPNPPSTQTEKPPQLAQTLPNANTMRPTLRVGSEGAAAIELQGVLKLMGYYAGVVDGRYDDETATAVTQFQQAAGLSADGVVGLDTWNRLFPPMQVGGIATPVYTNTGSTTCVCPTPTTAATTPMPTPLPYRTTAASTPTTSASTVATNDLPVLREGAEGSAVVELQILLQDLGFYQGDVDGVFGSRTADAVEAMQAAYGLDVDGVVGSATWGALLGY
ncbi:peptidoglycan-binding domain-containing protein [Baaleninema sp.]|uniref:peptidoglycan-binding domain-containing protein n=1 Tax=Baaleninema sp. TaxID=3101197 RepID=UPI003D028A99